MTRGKVWYVGTHSPENPNFPGEGEIWLQEIDLANWKLTGERHFLWRGACGGAWAEGPHIYKKDGRYYLMIAEGGTSFNHADLVELSDGRWYMVALGVRSDEERGSNMGRETHLIPVLWEREPFEWQEVKYEWPVCAPQTGRVERINPLPFTNSSQHCNPRFVDHFDSPTLRPEWNFRRLPLPSLYSINESIAKTFSYHKGHQGHEVF